MLMKVIIFLIIQPNTPYGLLSIYLVLWQKIGLEVMGF